MQTDPLYEPRDKYYPFSENCIVETSNTDFISAAANPVPIPNIRTVVRSISFSWVPIWTLSPNCIYCVVLAENGGTVVTTNRPEGSIKHPLACKGILIVPLSSAVSILYTKIFPCVLVIKIYWLLGWISKPAILPSSTMNYERGVL